MLVCWCQTTDTGKGFSKRIHEKGSCTHSLTVVLLLLLCICIFCPASSLCCCVGRLVCSSLVSYCVIVVVWGLLFAGFAFCRFVCFGGAAGEQQHYGRFFGREPRSVRACASHSV